MAAEAVRLPVRTLQGGGGGGWQKVLLGFTGVASEQTALQEASGRLQMAVRSLRD